MNTLRRFGLTAVAALALLAFAGSAAHAQRPGGRRPIVVPPLPTYNPNYYLPNGMSIGQYAYNVNTLGRAYSSIPPYVLGYNPYPPAVYNLGPTYPTYVPTVYPPALYNTAPGYLFTNPNFYTNPYFSIFNGNGY